LEEIVFWEHPVFVHFPIALILLYDLIEVVNLFFRNNDLEKFSIGILLLGIVGGILSVISGNLSFQKLLEGSSLTQYHLRYISNHEYYASLMLWYFFFLLILKTYILLKKKNARLIQYLFTIFALVGSYILFITAELGGKLVYEFGIGTNLFN
jgi:uncharacterized membrane protein